MSSLGGKRFAVRLEGGFEGFAQGGLVLFHGHEIVDPALLDTGSRQFVLGVKRIDKKHGPVFGALLDEFPDCGDFVALFFDGPGSEEAAGFPAKGADELEALRAAQLFSVNDDQPGDGGAEQVVKAGE